MLAKNHSMSSSYTAFDLLSFSSILFMFVRRQASERPVRTRRSAEPICYL